MVENIITTLKILGCSLLGHKWFDRGKFMTCTRCGLILNKVNK